MKYFRFRAKAVPGIYMCVKNRRNIALIQGNRTLRHFTHGKQSFTKRLYIVVYPSMQYRRPHYLTNNTKSVAFFGTACPCKISNHVNRQNLNNMFKLASVLNRHLFSLYTTCSRTKETHSYKCIELLKEYRTECLKNVLLL